MCGIFGIFNLGKDSIINCRKAETALLTMKHRGPDAIRTEFFDNSLFLGHLRLSIIDLNECSNQPFQIENRYWIVYNGEIYNYIEIKEQLIKEWGYSFRTESDTEVLLRAYAHWGESCVTRFNGMWAFVIYDTFEKTLFCSRDRFGVKPFNYVRVGDLFAFSSEIKAIIEYFPELRKPNYNVIANFCRTSTGAQVENTWFENILRLQPGHSMLIKDNKINIYRYWKYPSKINTKINLKEAIQSYKDLFMDSVKLRMRSDVPVGTTLSSGIDSGSIVSTLRTFFKETHYTFTAVFPENQIGATEKLIYSQNIHINEGDLVLQEAKDLNLDAQLVDISYNNFIKDLEKIIFHLESGNSSPATFPLIKVMKSAKEKVTVILEGQGADELLLGYLNPNIIPILIELIKKFEIKMAFQYLVAFRKIYSLKYAVVLYLRDFINYSSTFRKLANRFSVLEKVYGPKLKNYTFIPDFPLLKEESTDKINTKLIKQHSGGLVNLLHYGDAISMAHSLESRLPFMDYRLVEFVFQLPWQYKVKLTETKYLHRRTMDGIVPNYILDNHIKFGFNSPLSDKFYENSPAIDILLSDRCQNRGLFDRERLRTIISEHTSNKKNHATFLFRLLSVELWFRVFIDARQ